MSIRATCHCGASFLAKPALAGKQVRCPSCRNPFTVPGPPGSTATAQRTPNSAPVAVARSQNSAGAAAVQQHVRVSCRCGAAFLAKPTLAGKQVRCSSCGGALAVPSSGPNGSSAAATNPQRQPSSAIKQDQRRVRVVCGCGQSFLARAALGGRTIACPGCQQPIAVPAAAAAPPRVKCQCGKTFPCRAEMLGKRFRCPACSHELALPAQLPDQPLTSQPLGAVASHAPSSTGLDPLGLSDGGTSPLAGDDPYDDLFGTATSASSGYTLPASKPAAPVAPATPKKPRRRREPVFLGWYLQTLRNTFDFSGRARRTEYWTFALVNVLLSVLIRLMFHPLTAVMLLVPLVLLTLIPGISVTIRRLHDTGRSGWHLLVSFLPIVSIILLIWMVEDSEYRTNEYGPCPK